jgi:hypothetical protein
LQRSNQCCNFRLQSAECACLSRVRTRANCATSRRTHTLCTSWTSRRWSASSTRCSPLTGLTPPRSPWLLRPGTVCTSPTEHQTLSLSCTRLWCNCAVSSAHACR